MCPELKGAKIVVYEHSGPSFWIIRFKTFYCRVFYVTLKYKIEIVTNC